MTKQAWKQAKAWTMRGLCFGVALLSASGCELFRGRDRINDRQQPPPVTSVHDKPTPEQLVAYLNRQADFLEAIETNNLEIEAKMQGSSVDLEGRLACQKPRYFHMVGKKPILGEQLLLGSNDERFWFYVNRENTLWHCSHTEYDKGTTMELPVPFQTEWVLEVLGMARIVPSENARVEEDKSTYKLIEDTTFRNRKVRKTTVFYKGDPRDDQPRVASRMIQDSSTGAVLCSARTSKVTRVSVPTAGGGPPRTVMVPQVITLEWPQQEAVLKLDLGRVTVNQPLTADRFTMPRRGGKEIDLARDQPTSRGVTPVNYK